ncbi:MAG: HAMP domain-containing histidine kinase [Lachnospiraceae bacterium]|nr:HAMP domain-containing histidine kinase [Lachnospiraceae bacterium]
MKNKLFRLSFIVICLIIFVVVYFYFDEKNINYEDEKSEQIVAINEINQLIKQKEYEKAEEKLEYLQEEIRETNLSENRLDSLYIVAGICIGFIILISGYIYLNILRPFDKLKNFAEKIAQGDFDIPLEYERTNFFGKFTWAFDSMRKEIIKARNNEHEAIENNKTVIATLSHDIKTPIASIRAYAEGLEANMDTTIEKRARYLNVIMKKCDEVSKLTNDLFLHSISDLEKIEIKPENIEICGYIKEIVEEISEDNKDVCIKNAEFKANVFADKNRVMQIVENIINNARKYAKTNVNVSFEKIDNEISIHFRDYGKGIPSEDVPFIFDKFYRGRNCENEQGSGLGLYIIKYLMEKMEGKVLLYNHNDGLEVIIVFKILEN